MPSSFEITVAANYIKRLPPFERQAALRQLLEKFKKESPDTFNEAGRIWAEVNGEVRVVGM